MKIAAIDIETTGLSPVKDRVLAIAIVTDEKEVVIDTSEYTSSQVTQMLAKLRDEYDVVIAHNSKFDASFLYVQYGILFRNLYCTMLASQIIKNGHNEKNDLLSCLGNYLGIHETASNHKTLMRQLYINHQFGTPLTTEMKDYVLDDTKYLIKLREAQMLRIKTLKMEKVIALENSLTPVLIKMELGGCLIDRAGWVEMLNEYEAKHDDVVERLDAEVTTLVEAIPALNGGIYTRLRLKEKVLQRGLFGMDKEIVTEAKGSLNYGSQQQVIEFIKRVDGVELEAVGIDDIKTYINEQTDSKLHKFLEILLEFREYEKMLTTYGTKLLQKVDNNGYIHTVYKQCKTKTGRLASASPNLQNIPNGKIREFFIAKPGHVMITSDMASAEIRIAADLSGDPLLVDNILHGADMHSQLASVSFSLIFGEPITITNSDTEILVKGEKYTAGKLRKIHKSVTFAKFYKAGANRIYQTLAEFINKFYSTNERILVARKVSKALDNEMPDLTKFLSGIIKKSAKQGFLRGPLGRIRFFPEEAYGEAANYPIQNANAEAMKIALIKIDKYLERAGYGRLVMNIHDEVVVECPEEHAQALANTVQEIMAWSLGYVMSTIKGEASVTIKPYWEK